MRYTLAQLRKTKMPHFFEEELNLSEDLNGFEDIIGSKTAYVTGEINEVGIDEYLFKMNIQIDLVLQSAISLKEVEYHVDTDCEELYGLNSSLDEDINLIEGQTIDTKEAVITNIIINKPMRVVLAGEELKVESPELEEKTVNSAFASLKDLLDK